MKKKIAQFFCFAFWALGILAVYILARCFFFPPTPPNFLWLLPLFLAVAAMTIKEAWFMVGDFGENGGWITSGLIGLFIFNPLPAISYFSAISPIGYSLILGFGTIVTVTATVLFFSRKKDKSEALLGQALKWMILVVWSVWLGFSIHHIATGSGFNFFGISLITGFLCLVGGIILIVFFLILREIVKFLLWLHRYALSEFTKAKA